MTIALSVVEGCDLTECETLDPHIANLANAIPVQSEHPPHVAEQCPHEAEALHFKSLVAHCKFNFGNC